MTAFTKIANNFYPTKKFTGDITDTDLTFLDICVCKDKRFEKESILDVHVHFKPTETFQYMPFNSCHPLVVRKGFIKGKASMN